jgi:hypothetical protein
VGDVGGLKGGKKGGMKGKGKGEKGKGNKRRLSQE